MWVENYGLITDFRSCELSTKQIVALFVSAIRRTSRISEIVPMSSITVILQMD
jgi:hypothetical protein